MSKIFINTIREGYSPDQCGKTLTVGELIKYLSIFDADSEIYLRHDGGYTYGSISSWCIGEEDEEEEDEI